MRRVLVVCTANRCRSPMAEGLIGAELALRGDDGRVTVESAGTWAEAGLPPTDFAIQAMAERGIDIAGIRAREIDAEMVEGCDLILVMTESHRVAIRTEFPSSRGKVLLMSSLDSGSYNIADPVAGGLDDYRATASELARLVSAGWAVIVGGPAPAA